MISDCDQSYEDPLDTLPVRPDGAISQELGEDGRWYRSSGVKVPVLKGIHGEWHGYSDTAGWSFSFGWPEDHEAFRQTVLYVKDKPVAELWWYRFPSDPDLIVAFLYTSMESNSDTQGDHEGHHKFVWWGEIVR